MAKDEVILFILAVAFILYCYFEKRLEGMPGYRLIGDDDWQDRHPPEGGSD